MSLLAFDGPSYYGPSLSAHDGSIYHLIRKIFLKKNLIRKKRRRMVLSQMEQTLKTKKEMEHRHGPSLTGCNAVAQ